MKDPGNGNAGQTLPPTHGSEEHKAALLKSLDAIKAGYGGVMPNGNIVDRREIPSAIPIPANSMMGTPEPKPAIEQDCPDCYGGHFRPCQMCGDTGRVVFLPNDPTHRAGTGDSQQPESYEQNSKP